MVRLFEGGGAREAAIKAASQFGPLFYPEKGSGGLKREDALEIVEWMNTPLGKDVAIVVGPMDAIRQGSSDALLKVIEEPPVPSVHLYMWCDDAGQVSPTILSRVSPEYCQGISDEDFSYIGRLYIRRSPEFFSVLQQWKGREKELVRVLASELDPLEFSHLSLWSKLRDLASSDIVTSSMVVATWFD